MTASIFSLREAEVKFEQHEWATSSDLLAQLLSWELNKTFGPDTQEKISYLIDQLKISEIAKDTQYSLVQTDEGDNSEIVIFRRYRVRIDIPPKLQ